MPYNYYTGYSLPWQWLDVIAVKNPPVIEDISEEGDMINNFRVGCDPEFILLDKATGLRVAANKYFMPQGEIGYDHGGRVAEFRPAPSKGVLPIIKKIQALIKSPAMQKVSEKLRAGAICQGDCLGGHVHFGFNPFATIVPENGNASDGYMLTAKGGQVVHALDALTQTLERLDILPSKESAARRVYTPPYGDGHVYGRFGDVRNCKGHMEYRTMASWLYDPRVAFLCLTAAKLAAADPVGAYEALRECDSFARFKRWIEGYVNQDRNAARASEKLLDKGLKSLQVDPEVDFKERWEELGL